MNEHKAQDIVNALSNTQTCCICGAAIEEEAMEDGKMWGGVTTWAHWVCWRRREPKAIMGPSTPATRLGLHGLPPGRLSRAVADDGAGQVPQAVPIAATAKSLAISEDSLLFLSHGHDEELKAAWLPDAWRREIGRQAILPGGKR